MADRTSIEWTDATWNVVNGCSVISPGCTHCYAMKLAGTRMRNHPTRAGLTVDSRAGPVWNGEIRVNENVMDQPLRWSRRRMIFANAHGDLFHERVDMETIARVFGVAIAAHHLRGHVVQFLTKRAERQRDVLSRPEFWEWVNDYAGAHVMERVDPLNRRSDDARATLDDYAPDNPPPGIWIGTSVEDQVRADERVPHLLATPAAVRWLSMEPLLGPVDLSSLMFVEAECPNWEMEGSTPPMDPETGSQECCRHCDWTGIVSKVAIDWIVVGGESGNGARRMEPAWARSLRDQCATAGVPFLFKQWGAWAPLPSARDPDTMYLTTKKAAGRLLDGVQHDGFPA